jgi:beta-glucanase (GH16 family)
MQSIRKKIAVSAGMLMATAGVVASVQTAPAATSVPPVSARQKATVTVSIVPGVIGPGGSLKSSKQASWAVIGKYGTGKVGKKVVLQRKSGSGWVTADKSVVDKKGNVVFAVSDPGTRVVTYRVDGPGSASDPVSTDSWGTDADFVDEFSGSKLNQANWSYRQSFYEPDSKRECSKGDPKAVKVSGGSAKLSVLVDKTRSALCKPKKPGKNVLFGKFRYRLNANIGTQFKHTITYGVVSARIKFQPLQGQHASLWMQPQTMNGDPNPAVAGTEIDIIEWFGKDVPNGGLTSFIYAPSRGGKKIALGGEGGWIKKPDQYLQNEKDEWYKRYHVFSVEWNPSGYIFRIDGQETGRINKGVSAVPEYPILSILSSDYELSKLPGKDEKKNLPQTMEVDWIHTWQDPAHLPPTPTATPAP